MSRLIFDRLVLRSSLTSILPPAIWGNRPTVLSAAVWLLPLGMWGALWLSLQSSDIGQLFKPESTSSFFREGVRAALPVIAASWALVTIFTKFNGHRPKLAAYIGPLGLMLVYGTVGFASTAISVDATLSLYWTGAYISVPLVLFALVWDEHGIDRLHLLLNITWFIFLLAATILFVLAITKLDLTRSILNPIDLFRCEPIGHWFTFTHRVLRSTGVGRYAAIAAIISLSFIWRAGGWRTSGWRGYSRIPWGAIFVGALILLMSTGARTSIFAFGGAALAVFLLYGGKKSIIAAVLAIAVVIPLAWATGFHNGFFNGCIFNDFSTTTPAAASSNDSGLQTPVAEPERPQETVTPPAEETSPQPEQGPSQSGTPQPTPALPGQVSPATATPQPTSTMPGQVSPGTATPQPTSTMPGQESQASWAEGTPVPSGSGTTLTEAPEADVTPQPHTSQQAAPVNLEPLPKGPYKIAGLIRIPRKFFTFSGRTGVWEDGLEAVGDSPLLGHGFQSDRLLLGTHIHNAFLQALIQTGTLGATAFVAAVILVWMLMIRAIKNLGNFPADTKHTVILAAGLLVYLSVRSIPESTGAFFGVDWLILAPILLYVEVVSRSIPSLNNAGQR